MISPYQSSFEYLYPRPLISPSSYLPLIKARNDIKPQLDEPNTAAHSPLATVADKRVRRPRGDRFAHIRSKISAEETAKYFDRRRQRAELRLREKREKEELELAECTFHPKITEYRF